MERNTFYNPEESEENEHVCRITGGVRRGEYKPAVVEGVAEDPAKRMTKHPMPEQGPPRYARKLQRGRAGLHRPVARDEAARCLNCKNPQCVQGCPVNVRIPEFIACVKAGEYEEGVQRHQQHQLPRRRLRPRLSAGEAVREQVRPAA